MPIIAIDPNETAWMPDKNEIETKALLAGERDAEQWWLRNGAGLDLTGRNLRGLRAPDAYLPKFKPGWYADLRGENLSGAQLQGADLRAIRLQGAHLIGAHLRGANLYAANLQGAMLAGVELQESDLVGALLQGAIVGNTSFQPVQLPGKSAVVYDGLPFLAKDIDWGQMPDLALIHPAERELYSRRMKDAKNQKMLTEVQARNILHNQPDVVWLQLIPALDNDESFFQENISVPPTALLSSMPEYNTKSFHQENVLAIARGLRSNYAKLTDKYNPEFMPDPHSNQPEYLVKINQAFCASKRLKALCEPQQQAAAPAKAAHWISSGFSVAH
jgi:hypothetical protein